MQIGLEHRIISEFDGLGNVRPDPGGEPFGAYLRHQRLQGFAANCAGIQGWYVSLAEHPKTGEVGLCWNLKAGDPVWLPSHRATPMTAGRSAAVSRG